MTKEEIYMEYMTKTWVSETGLGRLDPYPLDSTVGRTGLETVQNENGILFLVLFLLTSKVAGVNILPYRERFDLTVSELVRKPYQGLFNRQPYGNQTVDRHEAHDNYAAITGMSMLFGLGYAPQVVTYGEKHGGNYNNVDPNKWEAKQQRQGGEMAFYKVMAYYVPPMWEWIWLMGGLLINAFNRNAGETQLAWLRIYCLSRVMFFTWWQKLSFAIVSEIWLASKKAKFGNLHNVFKQYFQQPTHPILQMAKFCDGFGI